MREKDNPRRAIIVSKLKEMLAEISGIQKEEIADFKTFFELGLDSLSLLQVGRCLKNQFGLKLSMQHLMQDCSTLDTLASYIEENSGWELRSEEIPAEPAPMIAESVQPVGGQLNPVASAPALDQSLIELNNGMGHLMAQQLDILRLQLEVLKESAAPARSSSVRMGQIASPIGSPTESQAVDASTVAQPTVAAEKPIRKPLDFSSKDEISVLGLTPTQKQHLDALIARYTQLTRKSKEYAQKHRAVLADSRAAVGFRPAVKEMLYPIVGVRAAGSHFWDLDDNEYVDLTNGFGVTLFGHHPPFLTEALKNFAGQEILLGPRSPLVGETANLISELTGLGRVAFSNSGTEAVMAAIRLARTKTGRSKIVIFEGSYHGHSDQTLVQFVSRNGDWYSEPMAPGIPPEAVANTITLEYGAPASLDFIRQHAGELAAVIVEPVQNLRLDLQPVEFLRELRSITRESGAAYIFDEMITGFRIHPGGAQAYFGIEADLVTYGKIIGGGMPIGVVAGKPEFLDGIDGGYWQYGDASFPAAERTFFGGTFCQHPLTMAAALATLEELKKQGPGLQERLNQRTTKLANTLNRYFEDEELPIRVIHFGSAFRFTITGNLELFFFHLLERGVYLWEWRGCFLSAAHTDRDLEHVIRSVKESVEELRSGGFLPARQRGLLAKGLQNAQESSMSQATPGNNENGRTGSQPVLLTAGRTGWEPVLPFSEEEVEEIPLTEAQRQLWLLSQIDESGSLAYKTGLSLKLKGPLRLGPLREAAEQIVARHETLRTVISSQGDCQRVYSRREVEIELIDFSGFPPTERTARIEEWFDQKAHAPMPLDRGPLFLVHILRLEEELAVLVLTAHHIITDGWSMTILIKELMAFYSAACRETILVADPPMQFRQYLRWQEEFQSSDELVKQESYWLRQFQDSVTALELPSDYPRPPIKTYQSRRCTLKIDVELSRKIKEFCSEKSCTLFMFLYAVYTALAHRLSGHQDLLIGISASGRSLEGSESLAGYCTHMLPIRNRIETDASFLDHLAYTRKSLLEAYEHQDYPFARLLNKLGLKRDASRSALISMTFNLDRPTQIPNAYGLKLEWFPHPVQFSDFDLMLNVIDINDELVVDCDYSTDLFLHGTIENFLNQYRTLLEGIVANPQERLKRLPLLPDEEISRILSLGSGNQELPLPSKCIHQMFEAQAERNPQATAVACENGRLTYGELNARANQLAHYLKSRGVGPEVRVGICLEPSTEMIIGMLGILKAGGAYVPLDPTYPKERLGLLLEDSGVRELVTQEKFLGHLPAQTDRFLVLLDADEEVLSREPTANPEVEITPSNLAYVIYTSGSTGRPKGVLIEHGHVTRLFTSTQQWFHFDEHDVWTLFHSYAFDFSVWEIFGALFYGGRLVVTSYWVTRNPDAFYRLLISEQVTVLNQTPSAFRQLMQVEKSAGVDPRLNLRLIIFGGEALDPGSLAPWFDRHEETRPQLINMYGITETTVHVTYRPMTKRDTEWSGSRIGYPIPDLRLYILDQELQPAPVGVIGEIYVGGAGVARGYLNREELTRERFLSNPFRPGERIYKTGDLGRWLQNGDIEYRGRIDEQVKIRGFRIELGEIASALRAHPAVKDVIVVEQPVASNAATSQLVAYFVPNANEIADRAPLLAALRAYLSQKLPDHMNPAALVSLDALPLTPNGKVDRRALPIPSEAPTEVRESYVAPRNSTEESLARIWGEVLGVKQVGAHDNFFELGGDSILGIQVAARANEAGFKLSLKDVYRQPTVAELAAVARPGGTPVNVRAVEQSPENGSVPLSPIQQWFFGLQSAEPQHYNMAMLLEMPAETEPQLLEAALQALLDHHDALRLTFLQEASGWRQTLGGPAPQLSLARVDLSALPAIVQESRFQISTGETQASLQLSEAPLMRTTLFQLGANQPSRLLIVIHHLLVDGVSWRILLEDLQTACRQLSRAEELRLPARTTSFKIWAERIDHAAREGAFSEELAYWQAVAEGGNTPIPLDIQSDWEQNTVASESRMLLSLDEQETAALLKELPKAYDARINDILLTALANALSRWTGSRSILVEVEAHGREYLFEDLDLSRTVGWFTSIYPVRLKLSSAGSPQTLLQHVKDQLQRVPARGIGFSALKYLSPNPEVRAEFQAFPRAEILFNYLGQFDQLFAGDSLLRPAREDCGLERSPQSIRSHLLEINGLVSAGRLQVDWTFSVNFHHPHTIRQIAQNFIAALKALIADCRAEKSSDLPETDLSEEQLKRVWAKFKA